MNQKEEDMIEDIRMSKEVMIKATKIYNIAKNKYYVYIIRKPLNEVKL